MYYIIVHVLITPVYMPAPARRQGKRAVGTGVTNLLHI